MDTNKKKDISEKNAENLELNSFFDGNHLYVYLYKKAEKLASALYMVTNLISEKEILRNMLREKSISVFSMIMQLQKMSLTDKRHFGDIKNKSASSDFILSIITEIVSLLEIANVSGYVSDMNFSILRREYVELGNLIKAREEDIVHGRVRLPRNFFDVPNLYETYALKQNISKEKSDKFIKDIKDNIKDIKIVANATKSTGQKNYKTIASKNYTLRDTFNIGKERKNDSIHPKTADVKHNNRRNTILELFQNKTFITVKDAMDTIDGCSSKTLQRELLSLVNEGILKKKGERRWSAYALA